MEEKIIEGQGLLPVLLNIKTTMKDETGEDQVISLVTEGKLGERNGHTYIVYEETELTGMKGSKSTLKIEPGKIVLVRYGEISTKMEFVENDIFMTTYNTPFGVFDMVIKTKQAKHIKQEKGGQVHLEYYIEISNTNTQRCIMELDYKMA